MAVLAGGHHRRRGLLTARRRVKSALGLKPKVPVQTTAAKAFLGAWPCLGRVPRSALVADWGSLGGFAGPDFAYQNHTRAPSWPREHGQNTPKTTKGLAGGAANPLIYLVAGA